MPQQGSDFKRQDRSVRRQLIIDAATQVFQEKGYRGATLDDVANKLGLSKAALYHYFGSKEDLLSTIYMRAIDRALENARRIAELQLSPREKMRRFIADHVKYVIIDDLSAFAVFFSEENQLGDEDAKRIRDAKKLYNRIVESLLEEGMKQGLFLPEDVEFRANAILGMCNSLYLWYRPGKQGHQADELVERLVSFLEKGYLQARDELGASTLASESEPERNPRVAWKRELRREQDRHRRAVSGILERY